MLWWRLLSLTLWLWPPTPTPRTHLIESEEFGKLDMAETQTFMVVHDKFKSFCSYNVWQHLIFTPSLFSLPLTTAVTTLSSFQGYRKTQAVITDCLMTDAKGTKRSLITLLHSFQQTSGNIQSQWKEERVIASWGRSTLWSIAVLCTFLQRLHCSWMKEKEKGQSGWLLVEGLHSWVQ